MAQMEVERGVSQGVGLSLSDKDREGALNLMVLYSSPSIGAVRPSDSYVSSVPTLDLNSLTLESAYKKEAQQESTLERMTGLEEKQPEKPFHNQPFCALISAVQSQLEESERSSGSYLLKDRSHLKRRAASVSLETFTSKRRGSSVDSESALSDPGAGGQSMGAMLTRGRARTIKPSRRRTLMPGFSHGPHSFKKLGAYSSEERKRIIMRYLEKRKKRVWTKKIKYGVRKTFADSRLRVKGRFISKEDESQLREMMMLCT